MTSQINPNNINGNYPVAGVPNNTQGMRDNFTATRSNFQFAAAEITELQSKVVLKQALTGGTLDNDMNDNVLRRVVLQDFAYTLVNIPATSGTITMDYSAGSYQQINPTGPCTLAFANFPPAGQTGTLFFVFNVTNVAQTLTFPASVSQGLFGIEGISPGTAGVTNTITFGRTGNYTFEVVTPDSGTTIYLYDLSRPLDKFFGNVEIQNDTAAISTVTGALTVDGGVGIGGNLYVGGDIVGNISITGVSVVGNVTGGNLNTAGLVSATGNVIAGNIVTAGLVSSTGNVNAGNIVTVNMNLTGNIVGAANVTGNVRSGNVTTVGLISAAGNITGGNIRSLGIISTTGTVINSDIDTSGNIDADGYISAVGNVTANTVITDTVVSNGSGNVAFTGNLIPTANVYTLGTEADPWASAYFGPESVTLLDSTGNTSNTVILENSAGNITMSTAGFDIQTLGTTDSIFRVEAITGQIISNANTIIQNTTDAANTTSGSLQTAGGAGIVKNLYVGNNIVATGNITGGNVAGTTFTGNVVGNVTGTATTATNLAAATSILAGSINIDPTTIGKNSTSTQTFTLTGLTTSHKVIVMPQADFSYGLSILAAYPSALNTLSVQFQEQGGGVDPPAFDLAYFAWV